MRRSLGWLAPLLYAALCAAQDPPPLIRDAGPVDPKVRSVEAESARYAKKAKKLKRYHESEPLEEKAVLQVLDSAGVFGPTQIVPGQANWRPFQEPAFRGRWNWPLRAGIVSSEFGRRWGRRHNGIDIAADPGVPVHAAAAGKVLYAGDRLRGYGNVVILRHSQETTTLYAHNQTLRVREGQRVKAGQVIATLGSTGHSTGPHLHFEMRVRNRAVNPRSLLPKSRYF